MHPTRHFCTVLSHTSVVEPVSRKTRSVDHGPLQSNYAIDINKYMLEGNNKTINARISMMRSNRTSILCIDPALIPLLGFGANNKKIMCYATLNMPKDLYISNAVMVVVWTRTLVDQNVGITLPHKR
jgi:hypothetical protein